MNSEINTVIIGAGVIGLATARHFAKSGHEVILIEKDSNIGTGISSRNSEVIHAGIYNPAAFLKTSLCITGRKRLYDYIRSHNIPFNQCGKLIVATNHDQIAKLEEIKQNALEKGICEIEFLSRENIQTLEPDLNCEAALFSPVTGIIDTHQYMLSLLGEAEDCGAAIAYETTFVRAVVQEQGLLLHLADKKGDIYELSCQNLINCAGLNAQNVAQNIEGLETPIPQLYYAKGNYFSLGGKCPFKHLIYPVPEPGGLGTHFTIDLNGQGRFGPDVEWIDDINFDVNEEKKEEFIRNIKKYYPALKQEALQPAYCGIRPKLSHKGGPVMDFDIQGPQTHSVAGLVNLFGIESPGLTASLEIASHIKKLLPQ